MPSAGKPVAYTRTAAQKLAHPGDLTQLAIHQAALNAKKGADAGTAPAAATLTAGQTVPTGTDATADQIIQNAYDAKNGTDRVAQ